MEQFVFLNVKGHVEVYDKDGSFLFSADNHREAMQDVKELFL